MEGIYTEKAPKPVGPYSQAIKVGNSLLISGQIGIDPSTGKLKKDFKEQVKQILKNTEEILKAAGFSKNNVVKVTVYLTDLSMFPEFNSVYEDFFKGIEPLPVRVTVGVAELPLSADIEMEFMAFKD